MPDHLQQQKTIITGISGQLGSALLIAFGKNNCTGLDRNQLNLDEPDHIESVLNTFKPTLVINPAAYTAVDKAESEPERAFRVNAESVGLMARWCARNDAQFVHYSTDYVFDGTKSAPYVETDEPCPLSVYGKSKFAGEQAILKSSCRHVIFRTSWVAGMQGNNFIRTILRLSQNRSDLRVIDDQMGAPTAAELIARTTVQFLEQPDSRNTSGIFHLTASGSTTWFDYAQHIVRRARQLGLVTQLNPEDIEPIPSSEYPVPAPRPLNSRLDTSQLCTLLGVPAMPNWQQDINPIIDHLTFMLMQGTPS